MIIENFNNKYYFDDNLRINEPKFEFCIKN